jgi:hypothetical protein
MKIDKAKFLLPTAMSLIALADLPYGYYQLLRIVVTLCACWVAYDLWKQSRQIWAILFSFIAVISNPFFKIHMERGTHAILNVVISVIFLSAFWNARKINPN